MKDQETTISKFFLSVLGSLLVAAISANAVMLFQFEQRLTRLETTVQLLANNKNHIASNP